MIFEIISSNTIKITLTKNDMEFYNITFDKLDRSNIETKQLLADLIETIYTKQNIDLSNEKLFVEAFEKEDGGCLLYLSSLDNNVEIAPQQNNSLYSTIICKINNIETLTTLSEILYNKFYHIIHNSELLFANQCYLLILHIFKKTDKKLKILLSEYCDYTNATDVKSSNTKEYAKYILPVNAIEEIIKKNI